MKAIVKNESGISIRKIEKKLDKKLLGLLSGRMELMDVFILFLNLIFPSLFLIAGFLLTFVPLKDGTDLLSRLSAKVFGILFLAMALLFFVSHIRSEIKKIRVVNILRKGCTKNKKELSKKIELLKILSDDLYYGGCEKFDVTWKKDGEKMCGSCDMIYPYVRILIARLKKVDLEIWPISGIVSVKIPKIGDQKEFSYLVNINDVHYVKGLKKPYVTIDVTELHVFLPKRKKGKKK